VSTKLTDTISPCTLGLSGVDLVKMDKPKKEMEKTHKKVCEVKDTTRNTNKYPKDKNIILANGKYTLMIKTKVGFLNIIDGKPFTINCDRQISDNVFKLSHDKEENIPLYALIDKDDKYVGVTDKYLSERSDTITPNTLYIQKFNEHYWKLCKKHGPLWVGQTDGAECVNMYATDADTPDRLWILYDPLRKHYWGGKPALKNIIGGSDIVKYGDFLSESVMILLCILCIICIIIIIWYVLKNNKQAELYQKKIKIKYLSNCVTAH
jgi:hypothetical protein